MCDFVFDPSLWPEHIEHMDSPWHCPYPSLEGYQLCAFHLPFHIRKRELPEIEDRQTVYKNLINIIGEVDLVCVTLSELHIDDLFQHGNENSTARISFSTISEVSTSPETTVQLQTYIHNSFIDSIDVPETTFDKDFYINDSRIKNANFEESVFEEMVMFTGTDFDYADFSSVKFYGPAFWCLPSRLASETDVLDIDNLGQNPCSFKKALFDGVEFKRRAVFANVSVDNWVSFLFAEFNNVSVFSDINVEVVAHFREATFNSVVSFKNSELGMADFREVLFDASVYFTGSTFGRRPNIGFLRASTRHSLSEGYEPKFKWLLPPSQSAFERSMQEVGGLSAGFIGCEFRGQADFIDVEIFHGFAGQQIVVDGRLNLKFKPQQPMPIILHEIEYNAGSITASKGEEFFELHRATVGDVKIESNGSDNPFKQIMFEDTDFEGFDFRNNRPELRELKWDIHNLNLELEDGEVKPKSLDTLRREVTFSKAKAGALSIGDTYAASKFFVQEARSRREQYKEVIKDNTKSWNHRSIAIYRATANYLFDKSCKYAESSGRVVILSLATIGLFSIIYSLLTFEPSYSTTLYIPFPNNLSRVPVNGLSYLIFSFQAFSSFLLSGGAKAVDPLTRLIASIESFIGAFAVGLFVATLVRSVER